MANGYESMVNGEFLVLDSGLESQIEEKHDKQFHSKPTPRHGQHCEWKCEVCNTGGPFGTGEDVQYNSAQ
jgi:hypothetical protein